MAEDPKKFAMMPPPAARLAFPARRPRHNLEMDRRDVKSDPCQTERPAKKSRFWPPIKKERVVMETPRTDVRAQPTTAHIPGGGRIQVPHCLLSNESQAEFSVPSKPVLADTKQLGGSPMTHILYVIDASKSMQTRDATIRNKSQSRWNAVFHCVEEMLQDQLKSSCAISDTIVSLVIFNDTAKVILNREPLHKSLLQRIQILAANHKPSFGTNFAAGLQEAQSLTDRMQNDSIVLVFLSDGRPGDLRTKPPIGTESMQLTYRYKKVTYKSAAVYLNRMKDDHGKRFSLKLICLGTEGEPWLKYLAKQYDGTLFLPDLTKDDDPKFGKNDAVMLSVSADNDDADEEILDMKVKSNTTLVREKFEQAHYVGEVHSVRATTMATTLRSTFQSISTAVTSMRPTNMRERQIVMEVDGCRAPMSEFPATRMILDASASKISIAPGESPNARSVQISSRPFAQGGLRNVFRMTETLNGKTLQLVGKESRHEVQYSERLKFHCETSMCQAKAAVYAKAFNKALKRTGDHKIKVLHSEVYRLKDSSYSGKFRYLAVEEKIEGNYVKWNGNNGYVNSHCSTPNEVAQAFSHFSFQHSQQQEMVVDIQGSRYTYTDPQLHSTDKRYGRADRGTHGFDDFFKTHVCRKTCRLLGLAKAT